MASDTASPAATKTKEDKLSRHRAACNNEPLTDMLGPRMRMLDLAERDVAAAKDVAEKLQAWLEAHRRDRTTMGTVPAWRRP